MELSNELKEKLAECATAEEFLALARAQNLPLPDEALEEIAAGRCPSLYGFSTPGGGKPSSIYVGGEVGGVKFYDTGSPTVPDILTQDFPDPSASIPDSVKALMH